MPVQTKAEVFSLLQTYRNLQESGDKGKILRTK